MKKILFILLIGWLLSIVFFHLNRIHSSTNEIDNLNQVLNPIKTLLVNQPNISFIADKQDLALYYKTQFILVPTIVENKVFDNDTILVIENKRGKKIDHVLDKYKILYSNSNDDYNIFLYLKNY